MKVYTLVFKFDGDLDWNADLEGNEISVCNSRFKRFLPADTTNAVRLTIRNGQPADNGIHYYEGKLEYSDGWYIKILGESIALYGGYGMNTLVYDLVSNKPSGDVWFKIEKI